MYKTVEIDQKIIDLGLCVAELKRDEFFRPGGGAPQVCRRLMTDLSAADPSVVGYAFSQLETPVWFPKYVKLRWLLAQMMDIIEVAADCNDYAAVSHCEASIQSFADTAVNAQWLQIALCDALSDSVIKIPVCALRDGWRASMIQHDCAEDSLPALGAFSSQQARSYVIAKNAALANMCRCTLLADRGMEVAGVHNLRWYAEAASKSLVSGARRRPDFVHLNYKGFDSNIMLSGMTYRLLPAVARHNHVFIFDGVEDMMRCHNVRVSIGLLAVRTFLSAKGFLVGGEYQVANFGGPVDNMVVSLSIV